MSRKLRATGKSTAIALELIAECIRTPLQWKDIQDHFPHPAADDALADRVKEICEKMGFQVEFRKNPRKRRIIQIRSTYLGLVEDTNVFDNQRLRPASPLDHGITNGR